MNPAEELRQAARILRRRYDRTTASAWEHDGDGTISTMTGDHVAEANSSADAEWMVLASPLMGVHLATWLESSARTTETAALSWSRSTEEFTDPDALRLARIIINTNAALEAP